MTATANIDYSLAHIWVNDPAGRTAGFLSPGLDDISWETMRAIVAGKEAVDAARAAVGARRARKRHDHDARPAVLGTPRRR